MSCLKIWREAFMPPLINLGRCFGLESHSDNVMPSPKIQAEHGHICHRSWFLLQWSSMHLRPNLSTHASLRFQGAVFHFYDKYHIIVLLKTCRLNLKSITCAAYLVADLVPLFVEFLHDHTPLNSRLLSLYWGPLSKAGLRHAYTVYTIYCIICMRV